MGTKVCRKCNIEKPFEQMVKNINNRSKLGITNRCLDCNKKYKRDYYLKNRENIICKTSLNHKINKESANRANKKQRENLTDSYINKLLISEYGFSFNNRIFNEAIKAKREIIKLKRLIKNDK